MSFGCFPTDLAPVAPLDHKLVLKHDEVALSRFEGEQLSQLVAESVKDVSILDRSRRVREETELVQTRNDALSFLLVGEFVDFLDTLQEGTIG